MAIAVEIVLTSDEKNRLEKNIRSRKTSVRLQERSWIVLLASEGMLNGSIADELGIGKNKVGRWRSRYGHHRHAGIEKDLPRGGNHGGKLSIEQAKLRSRVIEMTMTSPPDNATHWSTRSMATVLSTSASFIGRVWRDCGFKPHLIKQFKISNDPQFEEKLNDIAGLYLSPPENAVVLCVDEKSSIQALDRTQPGLPLKKGRAETMTHDYKRHGTSTLFAALNVTNGGVIGECKQRHRHQEFLSFLKTVEKETPQDKSLHLIVDNYATHKHIKVKNWLKRNKRVHLHFIPTSSSWLNLVERFFGLITEKQIRRGVFTSVADLEGKIDAFIENYNKDPKPFVWTKTTEEILVKVNRAGQKLTNP